MAIYTIQDTTLTDIADAIREKSGTTDLIAPLDMARVISAIETGGGGDIKSITLTGNQAYGCAGEIASEYIKRYGNTISTEGLMNTNQMFQYSTLECIPFSLNINNTTYRDMNSMFFQCNNLQEIPVINNAYPSSCGSIFESCYRLREFPEDFGSDWNWSRVQTYAYADVSNFFSNCYSLRRVPVNVLKNLWGIQTSGIYTFMYYLFTNCYVLDEVRDVPVQPATLTSNCFSGFVDGCMRLKSLTFATNEDGTPKTANWKNQVIQLYDPYNTRPVGYAYQPYNILQYNSGIIADKEVKNDATYQALKNDPDWWSCSLSYSRYNHDSAVETINSLPDTSAYGTNTIKFKGEVGSKTDGGAINTLTEEEIAVATSKGWTVSFA